MITFELFTLFDTFMFQCQLKNTFETSNKLNKIYLKEINLPIFKVEELNWTKTL